MLHDENTDPQIHTEYIFSDCNNTWIERPVNYARKYRLRHIIFASSAKNLASDKIVENLLNKCFKKPESKCIIQLSIRCIRLQNRRQMY